MRDAAERVAVWRERQTRYGAALEVDTLAER